MTIEVELAAARERLDLLMEAADLSTTGGRMALSGALLTARFLSQHGDEDDTRRLAGVLTMELSAAIASGNQLNVDATAGELLAVLSEVADAGDEDLAIVINDVVENAGDAVVQFGRAWSKRRAAAA